MGRLYTEIGGERKKMTKATGIKTRAGLGCAAAYQRTSPAIYKRIQTLFA
jgi:hypothetical protein